MGGCAGGPESLGVRARVGMPAREFALGLRRTAGANPYRKRGDPGIVVKTGRSRCGTVRRRLPTPPVHPRRRPPQRLARARSTCINTVGKRAARRQGRNVGSTPDPRAVGASSTHS